MAERSWLSNVVALIVLLVLSPSLGLGQVHSFPALDTNNAWTGNNAFPSGTVNFGNTNILSSASAPRSFSFPCVVWDQRGQKGPDQIGDEGVGYLKDTLMRSRWTSAPNTVQNYEVLHLHCQPFSGGVNANNGPKTNYSCLAVTQDARTQGQHQLLNLQIGCMANGDCVGHVADVAGIGNNKEAGGEGIEGLTVQANQSFHSIGLDVLTATAGSISSGVISLSGATNSSLMGENLPVIITTPAKIYSSGPKSRSLQIATAHHCKRDAIHAFY